MAAVAFVLIMGLYIIWLEFCRQETVNDVPSLTISAGIFLLTFTALYFVFGGIYYLIQGSIICYLMFQSYIDREKQLVSVNLSNIMLIALGSLTVVNYQTTNYLFLIVLTAILLIVVATGKLGSGDMKAYIIIGEAFSIYTADPVITFVIFWLIAHFIEILCNLKYLKDRTRHIALFPYLSLGYAIMNILLFI